jgi:hypothetical protein
MVDRFSSTTRISSAFGFGVSQNLTHWAFSGGGVYDDLQTQNLNHWSIL